MSVRETIGGKRWKMDWIWLTVLLVTASYLYLALLWGWVVLRQWFGDRWWWLFLLNLFTVYLFLPLPLVALLAWQMAQPFLLLLTSITTLLALFLYGGRYLPKRQTTTTGPTLTVLTFNLLAYTNAIAEPLAALRTSGADVIGLQELNPVVSAALQTQLQTLYPYQVLRPAVGSSGMGVISRYPIHQLDQQIPGDWLGKPQVLRLQFGETPIIFINCHAISVNFSASDIRSFANVNHSVAQREVQMQALADFAAAQNTPVIAVGDFNTADQTRAYRLLTRVLHDAWHQGGWGLGHTFPGSLVAASSRPVFFGIPAPKWLLRIDYIFHSHHWRTDQAWIGPWDGVSDHRPVMARLRLGSINYTASNTIK